VAGDLSMLTPATQRLVRAAYASSDDLVDVESPTVALAPYETVCGVCCLAHNHHLPCTNCSGKG